MAAQYIQDKTMAEMLHSFSNAFTNKPLEYYSYFL